MLYALNFESQSFRHRLLLDSCFILGVKKCGHHGHDDHHHHDEKSSHCCNSNVLNLFPIIEQ